MSARRASSCFNTLMRSSSSCCRRRFSSRSDAACSTYRDRSVAADWLVTTVHSLDMDDVAHGTHAEGLVWISVNARWFLRHAHSCSLLTISADVPLHRGSVAVLRFLSSFDGLTRTSAPSNVLPGKCVAEPPVTGFLRPRERSITCSRVRGPSRRPLLPSRGARVRGRAVEDPRPGSPAR